MALSRLPAKILLLAHFASSGRTPDQPVAVAASSVSPLPFGNLSEQSRKKKLPFIPAETQILMPASASPWIRSPDWRSTAASLHADPSHANFPHANPQLFQSHASPATRALADAFYQTRLLCRFNNAPCKQTAETDRTPIQTCRSTSSGENYSELRITPSSPLFAEWNSDDDGDIAPVPPTCAGDLVPLNYTGASDYCCCDAAIVALLNLTTAHAISGSFDQSRVRCHSYRQCQFLCCPIESVPCGESCCSQGQLCGRTRSVLNSHECCFVGNPISKVSSSEFLVVEKYDQIKADAKLTPAYCCPFGVGMRCATASACCLDIEGDCVPTQECAGFLPEPGTAEWGVVWTIMMTLASVGAVSILLVLGKTTLCVVRTDACRSWVDRMIFSRRRRDRAGRGFGLLGGGDGEVPTPSTAPPPHIGPSSTA